MDLMVKALVFTSVLTATATFDDGKDGSLLEDHLHPPTLATGEGDQNSVPLPVFLEEPTNAFVVKNKPATLRCRAAHALEIYFKCNGVRKALDQQMQFVEPQSGVRNVEGSVSVSRNEMDEFFEKDKFRCECIAWSSSGQIKSQSAVVEVAYLRKTFEEPSSSIVVELSKQMQLRCLPPAGVPPPQTYWLKNGAVLEPDTNIIITSDGNLLINQARLQDTANYTCVAENLAAKRLSEPVLVKVVVHGGWSQWQGWSECSVRCGRGTRKRIRQCNNPAPLNGGSECYGSSLMKDNCSIACPGGMFKMEDSAGNDMDNDVFSAVDGKWSSWSVWSPCNTECKRFRKRTCTNPSPSSGGMHCSGKDLSSSGCTGGLCPVKAGDVVHYDGAQLAEEATRAEVDTDIALYIGLAVALAVFTFLVIFIYKLLRRKGRDHSMYNMAVSEYQPEYFPEQDKKNLSLPQQPDLTQTVVGINVHPCYEYPYTDKCGLSRSCSEHHYDVPHLSTPQGPPTSPSTSSHSSSVASSSCPATATPQHEPSSEKTPHSDSNRSLSSFTCSSTSKNSLYNLNSTVPSGLDQDCYVSAIATSAGCRLVISGSGVTLNVPEGSLTRGQKEEMFIATLREDRHRPKLSDRQTLLSPVVLCGPSGLIFKKPVIINFQHCASLKHGHWSVSVWCCDSPLEAPPAWQKLVTLGEETINTSMFTQLDNGQVYLVADSLMRFCLVGESQPSGRAVKQLRLAVFGPQAHQALDYNVKVYTVEDTASALQGVMALEKKLGGVLLDKTKSILFQDTNAPLILTLEDIGSGWKTKPQSDNVEIPFHHIWNSTHNHLHCSFALEKTDRSAENIQFRILASQKGSPTHRQMFRVNTELKSSPSHSCQKPLPSPPRNVTVTYSSGYGSSVATVDGSAQTFRLNKTLRKKLCQCLDPPNARGNDWRMLAQRLNVDRYINYFATKSSPTEHIFDLWEARHREPTAVTDLLNTLRVMGRCDAASILEQELGAWL